MPDIKLREAAKGTIKTLDKSAVVGQRMKEVSVRTKDKAERGLFTAESSPEEYASDRLSERTGGIARESAVQFDKQGRKAVRTTKENIQTFKARMERKKEDQPKKQAREKAAGRLRRPAREVQKPAASATSDAAQKRPPIKTVDRGSRTIKTAARSKESVKQGAKSTEKTTIKTTGRSVKIASRTAYTSAKTSEVTARMARKAAWETAKASRRAARTARAARNTARSVRATAKAVATSVKAIIAGTKALVAAIVAGGWIAVVIILIVVLFGCAVALFGGNSNSNSYTSVSTEVEAYEPLIRQYAQEYGIPEYVELIKAVMMQESGGQGLDPMQTSEGSFNTRYPHEPNSIQDPEYSIQCGVQELNAVLTDAEVESPIDMDGIKLALQGYNFGNGYIAWAKSNYGGYSYANAVEFSAAQAQRLGWDSYGDTQYPAHVLRYYPYGRAFTSGGNQAIVEVALTQLGNEGGQPYWSWYGFEEHVEWCACFVSWCADQCGYIDSGILPKFASCIDGANWFQSNNQWQDKSYEPQAGDIIFFDWDGDGETDHVGIVEKCEDGVVYTVEGNSGDACRQSQYAVGGGAVYGYGVPIY